jgi:hypothetical protein
MPLTEAEMQAAARQVHIQALMALLSSPLRFAFWLGKAKGEKVMTSCEEFKLEQDEGKDVIRVPWAEADELRARLASRGLSVTLSLRVDRTEPEARIEPWPGIDPRAVLNALREFAMR